MQIHLQILVLLKRQLDCESNILIYWFLTFLLYTFVKLILQKYSMSLTPLLILYTLTIWWALQKTKTAVMKPNRLPLPKSIFLVFTKSRRPIPSIASTSWRFGCPEWRLIGCVSPGSWRCTSDRSSRNSPHPPGKWAECDGGFPAAGGIDTPQARTARPG